MWRPGPNDKILIDALRFLSRDELETVGPSASLALTHAQVAGVVEVAKRHLASVSTGQFDLDEHSRLRKTRRYRGSFRDVFLTMIETSKVSDKHRDVLRGWQWYGIAVAIFLKHAYKPVREAYLKMAHTGGFLNESYYAKLPFTRGKRVDCIYE